MTPQNATTEPVAAHVPDVRAPNAVALSWYQNKKLIDFLDFVQKLIVVLGVPFGLLTYMENKTKERNEAEWMAYEKMDDRY